MSGSVLLSGKLWKIDLDYFHNHEKTRKNADVVCDIWTLKRKTCDFQNLLVTRAFSYWFSLAYLIHYCTFFQYVTIMPKQFVCPSSTGDKFVLEEIMTVWKWKYVL